MNKIILMIGTIILGYFIMLAIFPEYDHSELKNVMNVETYYYRINVISILVSVMLNCLVWGWFL